MNPDEQRLALDVQQLTVRYGDDLALDGVDLQIRPREFVALIGPNGGGKTTLLHAVLGLVPVSQGEIFVFGRPAARAHLSIGFVPQKAIVDPTFPMTALSVVLAGRLGLTGILRRFSKADRARAMQALDQVRLAGEKDRLFSQLSGGKQQRVLIARALASDAPLLLLDEPTAHLDRSSSFDLFDLLRELNKDKTIVLCTHDVGAVSTLTTSIACLNRKMHYHGQKELQADQLESLYAGSVHLVRHDHH